MWDAAERHPYRTVLLFVVSGLVIVDGVRRTLASTETPSRAGPLIAGPVFSLGAIPMTVFIRARPEFALQRTQALLAMAFAPILVSVAAAMLGAKPWLLWASLVIGLALVLWWVKDTIAR